MQDATKVKWLVFIVALVLVAAGAWLFFAHDQPAPTTQDAGPIAAPLPPPEAPDRAAPDAGPLSEPAPAVAEPDDPTLRDWLAALSPDPEFGRWLQAEGLLGRFVALVETVANGNSPRSVVPFLAPEGRFAVFERGGREYIDPAGYSRYDPLVSAFSALDANGCARLLARLTPWLERSQRQLGDPARNFRGALAQAIAELLRVPVVEGDIPLERIEVILKIADPELEGMSQAQKHLFRMGPDNTRRVQAKLRELGRALGLGPEQDSIPPREIRLGPAPAENR